MGNPLLVGGVEQWVTTRSNSDLFITLDTSLTPAQPAVIKLASSANHFFAKDSTVRDLNGNELQMMYEARIEDPDTGTAAYRYKILFKYFIYSDCTYPGYRPLLSPIEGVDDKF